MCFPTLVHHDAQVRRVMVAEGKDADILPKWLNFMEGIVDSDDLPLNVHFPELSKQKPSETYWFENLFAASARCQDALFHCVCATLLNCIILFRLSSRDVVTQRDTSEGRR